MNKENRMKTRKRFLYKPDDWRPSSTNKTDKRKPLFWLSRDGEDLFFVNDSIEILKTVGSGTGGFATADYDVVTVSDDRGYYYQQVKPGEAVKVDFFDMIYDSDFVLQTTIYLESSVYGKMELVSPAEKGGVGTVVLMWDNGELGKHVRRE